MSNNLNDVIPQEVSSANHEDETRKFIVVGANCGKGCKSVGWDKIDQVNLVDYDVVILIERHLIEGVVSLDSVKIAAIQNQISRMLMSGGELTVVTNLIKQVRVKNPTYHSAKSLTSLNSFLPFSIKTHNEQGDTIEKGNDSQFTAYVSQLKRWSFWIQSPGPASKFISNREGAALAGYFTHNGVRIAILPDIAEQDADEVAKEVLRSYGIIIGDTPAPDWAAETEVPGLAEIDARIDNCKSAIASAQRTLDELNSKRNALDKYKKLLYAKGDDFELIVADVLDQFGADLSDDRYGVEDLNLKIGNQRCVVEIHGTERPLKLHKVHQLLHHAVDVEEKLGERPKGILVANPMRKVPPKMRTNVKAPEFPSNVIDRAVEMKFAVVSGSWLFGKYCNFLSGTTDGDSILQEIVGTVGLIHLEQSINES